MPETADQAFCYLIFGEIYFGDVNLYTHHAITEGTAPLYYNAGWIVTNESSNPKIQILAWLDDNRNPPVAGILKHPTSKIIFIGNINGIETMPEPFTNNIVKWLFE